MLNGDMIVEVVEDSTRKAIKYENGIMIVTGKKVLSNVNITNQTQSLFYCNISLPDFIVPFKGEIPAVTYSLNGYEATNFAWISAPGSGMNLISLTRPGDITLFRGDARSDVRGIISYIAIGRWK